MPLNTLTRLRDELIDLYGEDQIAGFAAMTAGKVVRSWLNERSTIGNRMSFGEGDPRDPETVADYSVTLGELLTRYEVAGRHSKATRARLIVFAYTLWESVYRKAVSEECGIDRVESDEFGDLRRYRNAILHNRGRLQTNTKALTVFAKGDRVEPTADQLRAVFKQLVAGLNDIGTRYYGEDPGFKWGRVLDT